MPTVAQIAAVLEGIAPPALAESWDNVGLLLGDPQANVSRVMTCLTVTPDSAAEAIAERADLIVAHHPLPFSPLARLTTETPEGRLVWQLAGAGIALYSPHTAFDSAAEGINRRLAEGLGLTGIEPLVPHPDQPEVGGGRVGTLADVTLGALADRAKKLLALDEVHFVGDADRKVEHAAVACGSGGSFLEAARQSGCDCLVTGEARFHACLQAEATGVALLLVGHYASERFAVERLAETLAARLSGVDVWASRRESSPLRRR